MFAAYSRSLTNRGSVSGSGDEDYDSNANALGRVKRKPRAPDTSAHRNLKTSVIMFIEPRTLRSWISEGLLAPPFKQGRGARYPEINAARALAVRSLKEEHGKVLADIRKLLMLADESQIREWAAQIPSPGSKASSAREYLSQIRLSSAAHSARDPARVASTQDRTAKLPEGIEDSDFSYALEDESVDRAFGTISAPPGQHRMKLPDAAQMANIERLLEALESEVRTMPRRKARAHFWSRIEVTPDIELSVRGEMTPRERALFERMADLIRTILTTGGADNEKNS